MKKKVYKTPWWKRMGGAKYEVADMGLKSHGHRYIDPWKKRNAPDRYNDGWEQSNKKVDGKFISIEIRYCIYDGCGKIQERLSKVKICDKCGKE